jgi:hypothetical protein
MKEINDEVKLTPMDPLLKHKRSWPIIALSAALVLSLLANVATGWWLKTAWDDKSNLASEKKQLQSQVKDLTAALANKTKALAAAQKLISVTPTPTATSAPCSGTAQASASLKENIAAAISSRNTAALEGYMASSVKVVFAASEKGGLETPTLAVADLDYLSSATAPWNFSLSAGVLNVWKAGSYAQYFSATSYAGESANKYVVSFDFNSCGKINQEFVSGSSDLLN